MSTKAASKCHSRRFFNGMLPRACPKHSWRDLGNPKPPPYLHWVSTPPTHHLKYYISAHTVQYTTRRPQTNVNKRSLSFYVKSLFCLEIDGALGRGHNNRKYSSHEIPAFGWVRYYNIIQCSYTYKHIYSLHYKSKSFGPLEFSRQQ